MKKVSNSKLIIVNQLREYLAKKNNTDFTDSMTAVILSTLLLE